MVRDLTRGIGDEARAQCLELTGALPDAAVACVGGGSNAIGLFTAFIDDDVRLVGIEAGGDGVETAGTPPRSPPATSASCTARARTCCRTRTARRSSRTRSRPGSTIPGVGPEHSYLAATGRAQYVPATDAEAMAAFDLLCKTEGIIPAIESAHALAGALDLAKELGPDATILVNLSGRGDKDVHTAAEYFGLLDEPGRARARESRNELASTSSSRARARENRAAWSATCRPGFPTKTSIAAIEAMVDGGVDLVEVGLPVQRPGHGRPDDPGRRRPGAGRRARVRPMCSTSCARAPPPAPRPSS